MCILPEPFSMKLKSYFLVAGRQRAATAKETGVGARAEEGFIAARYAARPDA
jgi:hypothetical protein